MICILHFFCTFFFQIRDKNISFIDLWQNITCQWQDQSESAPVDRKKKKQKTMLFFNFYMSTSHGQYSCMPLTGSYMERCLAKGHQRSPGCDRYAGKRWNITILCHNVSQLLLHVCHFFRQELSCKFFFIKAVQSLTQQPDDVSILKTGSL